MPTLAVMRATAAAAAVALTAAAAAATVPAAAAAAAAAAVQQGNSRNKPEVRFAMRLVRAESASLDAKTADSEQVLAAPALTTLDGQTASVNVTGIDPTYAISLSPTVETAGDAGKDKPATEGTAAAAAAKDTGLTLQVLWSIRLAGKTLPAGVSGVTMTGATRVAADRDAVIAEVVLPDPKTGRVTRFRLVGKATVGGAGAVLGGAPAAAAP